MILRNAMISWMGIAASTLLALILTPFLVHHLGQAAYGVWILLVSLVGLAGFLDLGISSAQNREVAASLARNDVAAARRVVCNVLALYLIIGIGSWLIFAALSFGAQHLFNIPQKFLTQGRWALLALGASTALNFPMRTFEGILLAKEKHHLVYSVEMGFNFLRVAMILLILSHHADLITLTLVHCLVLVAGSLTMVFLSRAKMPLGRFPLPAWDGKKIREILKFGRNTMMVWLGDKGKQELPVLLLGMLSNSVAVAHFGVGARLVTNQTQLITMAVGVAQPRFSALRAVNDDQNLRNLLLRSTLYAGLLAGWIGLGFAFLGGPFINLWVGPAFKPSINVLHIMAGPISLMLTLRTCDIFLVGIGRHMYSGLVNLAEAALMVIVCWLLIKPLGVEGVAMGIAGVSLVLRPWLMPAYTCRQVGLSLKSFWLKAVGRAALALGIGALLFLPVSLFWQVQTWGGLVLAGALHTLLCAVSAWLTALDKKERAFWRERISTMLARWKRS